MSDTHDSAMEDTIMEERPTAGVTPNVNETSSVEDTSATQEAVTTGKLTVLRRSTRVVPKMLSKVTGGPPKKVLTKAITQDKAAQLEKILRSKTPEPKIAKPSLTPEEIEEDIILMGIQSATTSKPKTLLQIESKKSFQSLSGHTTSTANANNDRLLGTSNARAEAKLPQPVHIVTGSAVQLPTSAVREDPGDGYSWEEQFSP